MILTGSFLIISTHLLFFYSLGKPVPLMKQFPHFGKRRQNFPAGIGVQNLQMLFVAFAEGLNILTGETGAGKSILLGSVNLALGAKADKANAFFCAKATDAHAAREYREAARTAPLAVWRSQSPR